MAAFTWRCADARRVVRVAVNRTIRCDRRREEERGRGVKGQISSPRKRDRGIFLLFLLLKWGSGGKGCLLHLSRCAAQRTTVFLSADSAQCARPW